ncbi:hypothetical protein SCYAM73S_08568 [Streptomyces cyaneofuscatus]
MGGLIRAASTGRFAVQYLCRELGLEFRAWESEATEPWHTGKLGHLPQLDRWSAPGGHQLMTPRPRPTGTAVPVSR